MNAIIDETEKAAAREEALADTEREVGIFGRRAKSPAKKVACAELEAELREVRRKWREQGHLPADASPLVPELTS